MTDEELTKLVDKIAAASGYGGFNSSTMYGEFALDVAKAVREECAKLCDAVVAEVGPRDRYTSEVPWEAESIGVFDGATDCAKRIRGA